MRRAHRAGTARLMNPLLSRISDRPSAALSPRIAPRSWYACSHVTSQTSSPWNPVKSTAAPRSEEHTSELQSRLHLVCRLLLEKKKKKINEALGRGDDRESVHSPPGVE